MIDRESGGIAYDYLNGLGIDDKLRQSGGAFGTLYFLQDHLGSMTALTGAGGALIEQQRYEAFGANAGSVRTRYGYTGRERDDLTGLVYYRARWFDSAQGRFLSEDPISYEGGLNLYSYVDNNPVGLTDPMGLQSGARVRLPSPPEWLRPKPTPSPSDGKGKCGCDNTGGNPSPGIDPGVTPVIGLVGPRPPVRGGGGVAGLVVLTVIVVGAILMQREPQPASGGKDKTKDKCEPTPTPCRL